MSHESFDNGPSVGDEQQELWRSRVQDLMTVGGIALKTPLVAVELPGHGNTALLKLEQYQEIKSFKIRGAAIAMAREYEDPYNTREIVADSGGNHAQAVALAGARFHVPVRVIMSSQVPVAKQQATERFGAADGTFTLDVTPPTFVEAKARAKQYAREHGARYLSPYDDEDIIRGTATLVPEFWLQIRNEGLPMPQAVHVPVGGGGLISGIADVNHEQGRLFTLYGHGLTGADSAARSLRSNHPEPVEGEPNVIAEGLAVKVIGDCAHQRMRDGKIDDILTSTLAEVGSAFEWYRETVLPELDVDIEDSEAVWRNLPELSSMVAISGLIKHIREQAVSNQTHLVVISGGNVDRVKVGKALDAATRG